MTRASARVFVLADAFYGAPGYQYSISPGEFPLKMAIPVFSSVSGVPCARVLAALTALILGGCSFDLGSFGSSSDKEAPPKAAPAETNASEAQAATLRGQALVRSGKAEEALAEFDKAIVFDPHNATAHYSRGLLHQADQQHQLAIDDFSVANGLTPQRSEPLLGRAVSYLALDKPQQAAADLDEAAQASPQNAQIWVTRGLAYERLGDKAKAAESYSKALSIRPRDEAARSGFARVSGKPG